MTKPKRQEQEDASEEVSEVAKDILRMQLPISIPGLGHVNMYALIDNEGIWAVPFSLATLDVTGEPFVIVPGGSSAGGSADGTLIHTDLRPWSGLELVWFDGEGQVQETIGQPQQGLASPALSPFLESRKGAFETYPVPKDPPLRQEGSGLGRTFDLPGVASVFSTATFPLIKLLFVLEKHFQTYFEFLGRLLVSIFVWKQRV